VLYVIPTFPHDCTNSSEMKPEELKSGMANHWRTYEKDKQSGELCKYATASFFGEQNKGK
jgi:hypothetical protein